MSEIVVVDIRPAGVEVVGIDQTTLATSTVTGVPGGGSAGVPLMALDNLTDVEDTAAGSPGQVLTKSGSGQWVPAQASAAPRAPFTFTQSTPAAVWGPIQHNLGHFPATVTLFSPDYAEQFDEFVVQHLDFTQLRISMETPIAGVALIG